MDILLPTIFSESMTVGLIVGISASLLGVFIVLRKMALVGDALSHVALPGFALGILYHLNPFLGAFVFLVAGIFVIAWLEKISAVSIETITGILFTVSLALGLLLMKDESLAESLFGDISTINTSDVWIASVLGVVIIFFVFVFFNKFLKISMSYDLARTEQINVIKINTVFLLLLAASVALGIKVVGTLLMGALVIIPAAAAKNVSGTIKSMTFFSVIFGVVSVFSGIIIASAVSLPPGPIIVLSGTCLFVISIIKKIKRH